MDLRLVWVCEQVTDEQVWGWHPRGSWIQCGVADMYGSECGASVMSGGLQGPVHLLPMCGDQATNLRSHNS